jgi:hypothetical protein
MLFIDNYSYRAIVGEGHGERDGDAPSPKIEIGAVAAGVGTRHRFVVDTIISATP